MVVPCTVEASKATPNMGERTQKVNIEMSNLTEISFLSLKVSKNIEIAYPIADANE